MNWENRTRTNTQRKKASKLLEEVVKAEGYCCHWCGAPIICVRTIPKHRRISEQNGVLRYITDADDEFEISIATIDHLRPLAHGGDSGRDNLVAACHSCNRKRGAPENFR